MRQTGLAMPGTEPKDHRTTLIVEEAGRRVTLHQQPTPDRRVESWMTYTVAGPAHLDFTFRYRLHDPALFTRGFAGFFFANYIHEPENKSIYVLSRDGGYPWTDDTLEWTQYCTTVQGRHSAIVAETNDSYFGNRSRDQSLDRYQSPRPEALDFGPGDHGLFASSAPIRYSVPLLLGRREDMAFALMFQEPDQLPESAGVRRGPRLTVAGTPISRTESLSPALCTRVEPVPLTWPLRAQVVLCHGMGGGGLYADRSDRHPAWDFFLYTADPTAHPAGEFKGRMLYKKFEGRPDILEEYRSFQAQALGRRWEIPVHAPTQQPDTAAAKSRL
jgi:hypothetical protein